jgi:hypothetical protein
MLATTFLYSDGVVWLCTVLNCCLSGSIEKRWKILCWPSHSTTQPVSRHRFYFHYLSSYLSWAEKQVMATSFVQYQTKGFWSRDSLLEGWLCFAVLELRSRKELQLWESELHDQWAFYLEAEIMGGIDLMLDHFLTTAERKAWTLELVATVHYQLSALGDTVPVTLLNPLLPPGNRWANPPRTEWLTAVGSRLQALIEGKLLTNAASPYNYI